MDAEGSTTEVCKGKPQVVSDEAETDSGEGESLYHAKKEIEAGADVYEYEGEYNSYDVNEPALEIKKNDDGTYQIQIDLFRLWSFYDDAGKITAGKQYVEYCRYRAGSNGR